MFYLLVITATFGYALQTVLMAAVYRRMDTLSAISYRGLSLGISMAPVLFWSKIESVDQFLAFFPLIVCAAVLASIGNWFAANAYNKLPIGIANAICMGCAATVVALLGFTVLDESMTQAEMIWASLVVLAVLMLGTSKSPVHENVEHDVVGGLASCSGFGVFLGSAFVVIGNVSREMDPLAAGYFWELLIGLSGASIAILRGKLKGNGFQAVTFSEFKKILIFSSPTAVGTGCFTFAVTMGPMGVATAILSTMMVASTLLSRLIFKEKVSKKQWVLLLLCYCMVVGLKFSTS